MGKNKWLLGEPMTVHLSHKINIANLWSEKNDSLQRNKKWSVGAKAAS